MTADPKALALPSTQIRRRTIKERAQRLMDGSTEGTELEHDFARAYLDALVLATAAEAKLAQVQESLTIAHAHAKDFGAAMHQAEKAVEAAEDRAEAFEIESERLQKIFRDALANYEWAFPDRPFEACPEEQRFAMLMITLRERAEAAEALAEKYLGECHLNAVYASEAQVAAWKAGVSEARLRKALDGLVIVCGRTGNAYEDFEEQADAFLQETGVMRPGKDAPREAVCTRPLTRDWKYRDWVEGKVAAARAALADGGPGDEAPELREPLEAGRDHLTVSGTFQSDKYLWCAAGFVPLKITDPMARDLLVEYARRRRIIDEGFARDLLEALDGPGGGLDTAQPPPAAEAGTAAEPEDKP